MCAIVEPCSPELTGRFSRTVVMKATELGLYVDEGQTRGDNVTRANNIVQMSKPLLLLQWDGISYVSAAYRERLI